ncbi:MAG: glycoside hydrolase family 97 protein [Prolixibacteraceae bacterium]|nr:glycoside hydrolase family 97 protein [Prolixibacteraceae bacterium]
MKRFFLSAICFLAIYVVGNAQYSVMSPNSLVEAKVEVGTQIVYSVHFKGKPVLTNSKIRFEFKQAPPLGDNLNVLKTSSKDINETWTPVLKRTSTILNNCRELTLQLQEMNFPRRTMNLVFRAFDDGVAFRTEFVGSGNNHEYVITDELVTFNFTADHTCWAANHGSYRSSQENEYFKRKLSDINDQMVIGLPMTVKISDDCYAAITEANITDYAGMYLKQGHSKTGFSVRSNLAPLPSQPENGDKVKFKFPHKTPWRVIMLGDSPGKLVESEIVMNLNEPCAIVDPSWIKPGICAWDHWWSGEVKVDNETIKKYIDLASEMGWPYQLIDWQWYGPFNKPEADITKVAPQLDMPDILAYAKNKNVKCWVWLYYTDVNRSDFDKACALYESWGIAGIKIDFMDSDDQEMVNWYHRIVKTAAAHHLMVDFHGAYKPDGWRRTYPNLVTREGVLGNEYNKWSLRITPEHMTTLPFTRMLAGPMDFTPGGFLNRTPEKFENGTPAQVQGTRALQLAQFVVYDSPFQVACDHPDNYKGQSGTEFLKKVKTMWDDTKILNGQIGEYITSARRSGNEWFIGSMTNSETRMLEIKLDFLDAGKYKMVTFEDAPDAATNAENVMSTSKTVVKGDVVKIRMAPGGGFAAWLEPVK